MKKLLYILILILPLIYTSCQKSKSYKNKLDIKHEKIEPQQLNTKYYSQALFSIDTSDFYEGLMALSQEFPFFFEDVTDMNRTATFLEEFVKDTFCININNMVETKFKNLKPIENDIQDVLQRFNYYYPEIQDPTVYFYISGISYETPPVYIKDDNIVISLDYYLGNESKIYDLIGMPRYRSLRCQPSYIARDLAQYLYYNNIYQQRIQKDVLTEMIEVGKMYYFMEALNPSLPDSVLMGYSSSQTQWVEQHEGDVWASIVGNNMLYSKELNTYRNFFGDGPFTQAFSNESPARLGEYIGLQIVRSYMTNNDVSLQELMKNKDVQQIFQESQYKPKKN